MYTFTLPWERARACVYVYIHMRKARGTLYLWIYMRVRVCMYAYI